MKKKDSDAERIETILVLLEHIETVSASFSEEPANSSLRTRMWSDMAKSLASAKKFANRIKYAQ